MMLFNKNHNRPKKKCKFPTDVFSSMDSHKWENKMEIYHCISSRPGIKASAGKCGW